MPTDEPRLERALQDAAPDVGTYGVVAQVTRRRTRRRRNRRIAAGAFALVALLVVGALTLLVTRDDGSSPHIASPGAALLARVIDGDTAVDHGAGKAAAPAPVVLDQDPKLLRAPVLVGPTALSVASYDSGPDGVAPSHVVRIDGNHLVDIVDFKATRVLSIAEGEGARWVLTQNRERTGGTVPDSFLKRITGTDAPQSIPLPPNAEPVGAIAAVGGAVWIPLRNGLLQYSPTGALVGMTPLPDASQRSVALVGKLATVTDGSTLHGIALTLEPRDTVDYGARILGLAAASFDSRVLLAADSGGREHARVALASSGVPAQVTATLPDGFVANGLGASTTRLWATGTVDGAPAIVLLGDRGVRATVVLENAADGAALAWTDAHTVRAVSGGKLYEITAP